MGIILDRFHCSTEKPHLELSDTSSSVKMTASPKIRRVAVIGAGISGVLSAAHLIAAGIEVVVFERNDAPGGVW